MKNDKTIEQKLETLNQKMAWFDGEDFNLEEAFDKFNELKELASELEDELKGLKNKVDVIKKELLEEDAAL